MRSSLPAKKNSSNNLDFFLRNTKRGIVAVVGSTVLGLGIAMIVLPGPAVVMIPIGLALLATEFVWAQRLLKKARQKLSFK